LKNKRTQSLFNYVILAYVTSFFDQNLKCLKISRNLRHIWSPKINSNLLKLYNFILADWVGYHAGLLFMRNILICEPTISVQNSLSYDQKQKRTEIGPVKKKSLRTRYIGSGSDYDTLARSRLRRLIRPCGLWRSGSLYME
jgi:hypothetical protein